MYLPPPAAELNRRIRKHLFADALFKTARSGFERIEDHRRQTAPIALIDGLMSASAMFAIKDPSLLAFDARSTPESLVQLIANDRFLAHIRQSCPPSLSLRLSPGIAGLEPAAGD